MEIFTAILTAIGGFVVIIASYLFLFKKIQISHINETDEPDKTISVKETYDALNKVLIALNNLALDVKNCGACAGILEEVERITIIVKATQKKLEIEE